MSHLVSEVQRMASALVSNEIRSGESADGAMKRVARNTGVSYHALWQLRYRAPKRIFADVYLAIKTAHEATIADQQRKLRHDLKVAEACGLDPLVARAARRLGGIDRD